MGWGGWLEAPNAKSLQTLIKLVHRGFQGTRERTLVHLFHFLMLSIRPNVLLLKLLFFSADLLSPFVRHICALKIPARPRRIVGIINFSRVHFLCLASRLRHLAWLNCARIGGIMEEFCLETEKKTKIPLDSNFSKDLVISPVSRQFPYSTVKQQILLKK